MLFRSGDFALTAFNGATDQARQAVLILNGTPAAFTVYAPPINKLYIVKNNTTQTATIVAAAASNSTTPQTSPPVPASVTIPAGQTAFVFCAYNATTTKWDFYGGVDRVYGNLSVSGDGTFSGTGSLVVPSEIGRAHV